MQADSLPTEPPGKPKSKEWVAWWAAVYGVAQSGTRLKRRSSSSCWCQASLAHLSEGSVQAQENLIASKQVALLDSFQIRAQLVTGKAASVTEHVRVS